MGHMPRSLTASGKKPADSLGEGLPMAMAAVSAETKPLFQKLPVPPDPTKGNETLPQKRKRPETSEDGFAKEEAMPSWALGALPVARRCLGGADGARCSCKRCKR